MVRCSSNRNAEGFPLTSLREISTLLTCNHDNIVRVFELVVGDRVDLVFMVMEFVDFDMRALQLNMSKKKQVFTPSEIKVCVGDDGDVCVMSSLLYSRY